MSTAILSSPAANATGGRTGNDTVNTGTTRQTVATSGFVSAADPDPAGDIEAALSVTDGTLTLSTTSGLSISEGTGAGDTAMTFSGPLTAVNAALDGLVYVPPAGFGGEAIMTVNATDLGVPGAGASESQNLTIDVGAVADSSSHATEEGSSLAVSDPASGVLANDIDLLGQALAATLVSGPTHGTAHGTLALVDGIRNYTPTAGYVGPDSFTYTDSNQDGESDPATVTIAVVERATWTGAGEAVNWSDAQNWSGDAVPDANTYVFIAVGNTVTVVDSAAAHALERAGGGR